MSLNIFSDQANTTYIASGSTIDIKVRLYGNFALRNNGGATVLYPQLRMVVNGDVAWADLYTLSAENTGSGYKTDAVFRYVVKPGDMASPLRIYGFSGIGEVPGNGYQFYWNGWEICNQDSGSNAVWRANYEFAEAGFGLSNEHLNFGAQKVFIRTLAFDENDSPVSVAATQATTWRVTTVDPVESAVVDFYVWTTGTNMVQIGTVANQTALLVSMPTGSTNADFLVRGLAMGTANIYLQRAKDYQNNATVGVTNFIKRTITVTVAPEPTVSVVMSSTGTDNVTLNETSVLNTGAFTVNLSQAFTNDVYVRLDTLPAGQGYVTFGTSPFVVRIPAGSTVSSEQRFSVPDGNVTSMWGVVISPVVTNAAADSYFTIKRAGTVFVQNVSPTLILPAATDVPTAMRGVPFTFSWQASDGASDMADGMKATWNFNGETTTNVSGSSGSIAYTFNSTGTKTVKVKVTDKDGQVSDEVQFTVTVVLPPPKPSVRVVTSDLAYTETKTNSTGSLVVYLSEAYPADVWVQLTAFLMGASQSNIVFATTNAIRITQGNTNSPTIKFSLKDGTQASEIYGIDIVPTVTDSPAKSYFTDPQRTTVFVDNVRPTVTCPLARDMALVPSPEYTNIPMGRPFTFTYTVGDVDRDLPSMAVTWNFGDGCSAVVTGAMGNVAHTFSSLGRKYIMVQAQDKDGGYSDEIEFPITVVPPPPDPTVFILSPAEVLSETTTPRTGSFVVQLSEAFTNAVTVGLAVSPVTNAVNGAIVLSTNRVTFAVGETEKAVYISARDGTDVSWLCGFTIIPTVLGNAAAINYFKEVIPGYVDVMNVSPVITTPVATDVATDDFLYTVARGTAWAFGWSVSDVADDLKSMPVADALTVTWDFGDGGTGTGYGGLGTINHTYMASGDMIVSVTATDKDGGSNKVCFKVRVVATPLVFHVDASRPDDSGPGMDWSTAKKTIQAAVNLTADGDIVLVTNGVYNTGEAVAQGQALGSRVVITQAITVKSVNGAEATVIEGSGTNCYGTAHAVRCVSMGNGVLQGFTLRHGATSNDIPGGGVYMFGAAADTAVSDCIIRDNKAFSGGGSCYGTLNNCTFLGNTAVSAGGGSCYGTLNGCLLQDNAASSGGGAYYGALNNCTLFGNKAASSGGGSAYGTVNNGIVWANVKLDGSVNNYESSTFYYSCTMPMPSTGVGNMATDPLFADSRNLRLRVGSPCIDAGDNVFVTQAYDLIGAPRVLNGRVDMGAFEGGALVTATPVLTPANGTVFDTLIKVTMSCSTEGSEIRYTTDGTEPTRQSLLYVKAFNVFQTTTFRVKAFKDDVADSLTVGSTYYKRIPLNEAIDVTNLVVTTGGSANWYSQVSVTHDGVDAAQSGAITNNQTAWMETTLTGPGTVSFLWKTSCEDDPDENDWDYVSFSVDGTERNRLDGVTNWQRVTRALGEGVHTVRWEYFKDESVGEGADCAWVDQVSFNTGLPIATTTTPVPVPYAWLDRCPTAMHMAGGNYEIAAFIDSDLDGMLAWQEYVAGSIPTNCESVFRSLITMSNGVNRVTWTPDLGTTRAYTVEGRTNLSEGVWGPTNAESRFFRVKVQMP